MLRKARWAGEEDCDDAAEDTVGDGETGVYSVDDHVWMIRIGKGCGCGRQGVEGSSADLAGWAEVEVVDPNGG